MSTVGYGDIAPRTPPGKLAGGAGVVSDRLRGPHDPHADEHREHMEPPKTVLVFDPWLWCMTENIHFRTHPQHRLPRFWHVSRCCDDVLGDLALCAAHRPNWLPLSGSLQHGRLQAKPSRKWIGLPRSRILEGCMLQEGMFILEYLREQWQHGTWQHAYLRRHCMFGGGVLFVSTS